jgi:hypothetical protein
LAAVAVIGGVSLAEADERAATRVLPAALQALGGCENSVVSAQEAQDIRGEGTMEMAGLLSDGGAQQVGDAFDPFQFRSMLNLANRFTNMESLQNRFRNTETMEGQFANMETVRSQFVNMENLRNQFANVVND